MQQCAFAAAMLIFSLVMYAAALSLPPGYGHTSSATFPAFSALGCAVFSLGFLVSSWRGRKNARPVRLLPTRRQCRFLGVFLAYILALPLLGFKISSVLCFLGITWFWVPRERRLPSLPPALLLGTLTTALLWFVFEVQLKIFLP